MLLVRISYWTRDLRQNILNLTHEECAGVALGVINAPLLSRPADVMDNQFYQCRVQHHHAVINI